MSQLLSPKLVSEETKFVFFFLFFFFPLSSIRRIAWALYACARNAGRRDPCMAYTLKLLCAIDGGRGVYTCANNTHYARHQLVPQERETRVVWPRLALCQVNRDGRTFSIAARLPMHHAPSSRKRKKRSDAIFLK